VHRYEMCLKATRGHRNHRSKISMLEGHAVACCVNVLTV
jgi:hypothetical protein